MQLFMARMDEWAGLIEPDGNHLYVCGEPPQELVTRCRTPRVPEA